MLAGHPQSSRSNSLAVVTSYSNCHTYAVLHAWVPINVESGDVQKVEINK